MKNAKLFIFIVNLVFLWVFLPTFALADSRAKAIDIVTQCENSAHGDDNVSTFSIKVINRSGKERLSVYKRFWKFYNQSKFQEKMTLFTVAPVDAKNTAFMKISYNQEQHKGAEQWLYMPSMRKLKEISQRDKNEAFLGSDLTYDDINFRSIDQDKHKLLESHTLGRDISYLIESTPKENDSMYKRKVVEYYYSDATQACLKKNITYYDHYDKLLKIQDFTWQNISGVWLWKNVTVKNMHTFSTSVFEISNPKVNTGLDESWFSKRMLERGI